MNPLSNWTEMDVWQYIEEQNIPLPQIDFSAGFFSATARGRMLANPQADEPVMEKTIRFRTIGDVTCTGAVESGASNLDEVIAEVAAARQTERGTRADHQRSESATENRKKEAYF